MDTEAIIKAAVKGSSKAQRQLIDAYSSLLMSVCRRYCRSKEEAEDSLQDSWIRIFRGLPKYRERGQFKAWICRIAVNVSLRNIEKNRDIVPLENEHAGIFADLSPGALEQLKAEDLLEIINKLPERCSVVFKLYVIDGFSHRDIAELLEINESTSRVYLTRAREILREQVVQIEKVENQ